MQKMIKVLIIVGCIFIVGGGLWFANGIYGNPISKTIAKSSAEKYIVDTYSGRDFVIDDVFYNFKDGYYHVEVKSPSSIDTHFTVSVFSNKVAFDSYENEVLSGWNTYERINLDYMQMVERVFSSPNFPLVSEIDFGTIHLIDEDSFGEYNKPGYGVKLEDLELDKIYDIKELAKTNGHIIFYAQDKEISFAKASELLMSIKNSLDEANIPFYAIDFILEKPRTSEGIANEDDTSIHTANFLYRDIYEDGLAERIEKAHDVLMEYYAEQDAKLKDED